MLKKISVNALLKSVIAIMAFALTVTFAISAWNTWSRLATTKQIMVAADITGDIFTALHNLRVDRSYSVRDLNSDQPFKEISPALKEMRAADLPAMKSALAKLQSAVFPGQAASYASLRDAVTKLESLHQASAAALLRPKAERPPGLANEYATQTMNLLQLLEKISTQLTDSVKLADSFIDQLLIIKQLAWTARNAAGDNAVLITNGISGIPLPPDFQVKYAANDVKIETAWSSIEEIAGTLPVPAHFTASLQNAKDVFFGREFTELRHGLVKNLLAHETASLKAQEWSTHSVPKLVSLLGVAESALKTAKDRAADQYAAAQWSLLGDISLLAAAMAVAIGMMFVVSYRVTNPLVMIQQAMLKVAEGDFSVVLPGLDRKDEIGDVSNAVERFKVLADEKARAEAAEAVKRQQAEADRQAKLARAEAEAQAKVAEERAKVAQEQTAAVEALGVGLAKLSAGDLSFRLNERFPEAYVALKDNFNNTMVQLQETIGALTQAAREVTSASAEISSSTTDLSQRTEEQAASLEETTASMEEISSTVKKNAENAQAANSSAASTQTVADRGGQVVAHAVQAMAKIEESSRKIGDIIGVIDEIARQTNLLALNAAVEAARAGEAGRGFAVVASEVRSLAQRSSQAAKDIKDLITNSNSQVKDGVDLVNKAGTALNEIVQSIKAVAAIVSEIATASAEQATGIEQVNKALTQMDEVTQQNSALVEENAATAKTLEHQAKAMDERVAYFKLAVGAETVIAPPAAPAAAPLRGPAAAKQVPPAATPKRATAAPAGGPVGRMQAKLATAINDDPDWKEF
jgi:methyl-accepting chemotaxis protein